MSKDDFTFEGFDPANTTPVPDVFFDVLLPRLNEAQIKVMMYIIRRTLGFKKSSDAISLKQFRYGIITRDGKQLDQGCGLKNFTAITKALKFLEEIGCIESEKQKTASGDSATTVYRIRFRGTAPNVVPTTPKRVGVLREKEDRTTPNGGRVLREKEPQETVIQETELQETVLQERKNDAGQQKANAPAKQESHSSIHSKKTDVPNSSSQEKTKEKVVLNAEEERLYTMVCPHLFEEDPPEVTPAMKGHCAKIAKHVKSDKQLVSLIDFTRKEQHLEKKTVYFGNLARGLNGWLQTQKSAVLATPPDPNAPPVRPAQVTNVQEWLQMQEYLRYEDAQKERGVS